MRKKFYSIIFGLLVFISLFSTVQGLEVHTEMTTITTTVFVPPTPPSQVAVIVHMRVGTQTFLTQVQAYSVSNTEPTAENVFVSVSELQDSITALIDGYTQIWDSLTDNQKEWVITNYEHYISFLKGLTEEATKIFSSEESIVKAEFTLDISVGDRDVIPIQEVTFNYNVL
ncbi:MAG: hypothetical protein P8X91_08455 [Candidatus Bathyarchaeota archaeon]